jgi:gamma-glutamylcyclotransferase (GGCT)/AIG2-like uncharacterized protein YtfP
MAISGSRMSCPSKKRERGKMTMNNETKLYIAYGSNMNLEQMALRCPTARVIGTSQLTGHRLLFRGGHTNAVATVEPCKGKAVPVLVWEIAPADEDALDRYEGFPFLYRKENVKIKLDGEPTTVMVYIMNVEMPAGRYRPLGKPNPYYYTTILEGYKDAGFDIDILRQATIDSANADQEPQ